MCMVFSLALFHMYVYGVFVDMYVYGVFVDMYVYGVFVGMYVYGVFVDMYVYGVFVDMYVYGVFVGIVSRSMLSSPCFFVSFCFLSSSTIPTPVCASVALGKF